MAGWRDGGMMGNGCQLKMALWVNTLVKVENKPN
jgi:hypothetical protein